MAPIITSQLDTDLYKFTMWQAMLHRNPQTEAEYEFVCRTKTAFPLAELLPEVERELDALCALRFTPEDLAYLGGLRFMKSDFIDFLRIFQFQRAFIRAWADGDTLHIEAKGPQVHVMGFEIYVLAIVNELYFRRFDAEAALAEGRRAPGRQDRAPAPPGLRGQAAQSLRAVRLRRAPALLGRLAARGGPGLCHADGAVVQGNVQRAAGARLRHRAHRHHGP